MTIDIESVSDASEWNDLVDRNETATPFHRWDFLESCAEHSGTTLHPYVGYKGQEPVGLFPLFELRKGPVTTAFSPPPDLKVTYLGPAPMNMEKLSQRKRDRRNRRFVEGCLETLSEEVGPRFVNVRTSPRFEDPRPFVWNAYEQTPRYTYVVDLTPEPEDLLMDFSSDARKNVRTDQEYEIRDGDPEDSAALVRRIQDRHDEQGVDYEVPAAFVADLHRRLAPETLQTYVCERNGSVVGGLIALSDDETTYRWQSWADHGADLPATDLLDWHVIRDAREAGRSSYDLVGANDPRLSRYKAKYAPELHGYASLQYGSRGMTTAANLYDKLR